MDRPSDDRRGAPAGRGRTFPWRTLAVATVLGLAALHVYSSKRIRETECAHPPTGRFVETDGVRLHYTDDGEGQPPLVLLHGATTMGLDFALSGLVAMASKKHRVIVFDRPGYGYSTRPRSQRWDPAAQAVLLLRALAQIGVEQPILVGHSWGAMVAVAMAAAVPKSVRGLLLLSGYYFPTARIQAPFIAPIALPVIGSLMRYVIPPLMFRPVWAALTERMFAPAPVPGSFARFPAWMALRPVQLRASAEEIAMAAPMAARLRRHYRSLLVPMIVMAGSVDRLVRPQDHSVRLHAEAPHSELRIVPGVGHMIHHTAAHEVMSAIDDLTAHTAPERNAHLVRRPKHVGAPPARTVR